MHVFRQMVRGAIERPTTFLFGLLSGVVLAFFGVWSVGQIQVDTPSVVADNMLLPASIPELEEIARMRGGFGEFAPYFKDLAEKKGAGYAFAVLRHAKLPPNLDLHLLGHTIGDELYKQEGIEGIAICTNEFRNACSHSIVVGALIDGGEGALPAIADVCKKAPGGRGAYTMCFHGLGHGILAYFSYELEPTIAFCEKVGTSAHNNREYIECVGGAIMEIIGGGGHDRELFERVAPKYFKNDDPLYPCTASFMPALVRPQCLQYLTPHLFEAAGGDIGFPTPEDFKKAFRFCDALSRETFAIERDICFGGFGKEFVALAQDRDIRRIADMTSEQLEKVVSWCSLAGDKKGELACDAQALQSLYWGGENHPGASLRFCAVLPSGGRRTSCYQGLASAVAYYVSDESYRRSLCGEFPEGERAFCVATLLPHTR